jgi:hypothetical protein
MIRNANNSLPWAEFYAALHHPLTAIVIATGEEERLANMLITIGVVKSEPP